MDSRPETDPAAGQEPLQRANIPQKVLDSMDPFKYVESVAPPRAGDEGKELLPPEYLHNSG